jgi:phosphoribosylglycinamide formyltransferase 1
MKVAILTADELRHEFFRKAINSFEEIDVCCCICESKGGYPGVTTHDGMELRTKERRHVEQRRQTEIDFFDLYVKSHSEAATTLKVEKDAINLDPRLQDILRQARPDLIVSYGCSIIREPVISWYPKRFINVHLGLSPYYRGSGTNFWPLANGEPSFVGVTYMQIDPGIDTGPILHQLRPNIFEFDNVHSIGNRLIKSMTFELNEVLKRLPEIQAIPQWSVSNGKFYRRRDFSRHSVDKMERNFADGMLTRYLDRKLEIDAGNPIVQWGKLV